MSVVEVCQKDNKVVITFDSIEEARLSVPGIASIIHRLDNMNKPKKISRLPNPFKSEKKIT